MSTRRTSPKRSGRAAVRLAHLNQRGEMHMVDVAGKSITHRTAVATTLFQSDAKVIKALITGQGRKGDAMAVARLAGILGAKKASSLIPLCHPLSLTHVEISISRRSKVTLLVTARCESDGKTGVEMEALLAAAAAALTLYDMSKSLSRSSRIGPLQLDFKDGGKSGRYQRRGR